MPTKILEQIGLSKNEIKVYFALLELDQSSATPIMRKSGVPHSKVYPVLEKLIRKGLVSYVIKGKVKHFQASSLTNIIDILDKREKQIISQREKIKKLIPQIELKKELGGDKQEAMVYEGKEGIKAAFGLILNALNSGGEYLVFSLGEELGNEDLRRFYYLYQQRRMEKKLRVRLIANNRMRKIFSIYHKYKAFKIRYTSLNLPTGIFIFGNNVMTVIWGDKPTAFVIASKNNAARYKEFFEDIWKKSVHQ